MIVIADMGATKCDWSFADGSTVINNVQTKGFNPYFYSTSEIISLLKEDFESKKFDDIKEVYLYGAGCSNDHKKKVVEDAVSHYFPTAKVEVDHDLLGSARALCGKSPGIACILGTGSNTCLYDGTDVIANNPSLGFLLGDEGSGGHLGKELVKAYYYGELPKDLSDAFEQECNINKDQLLDDIYATSKPNAMLAQYTKFMNDHKENPVVHQLIKECFDEFFRRHIYKYDNYQKLPINFVGSIAYHFREILEEVAKAHNCSVGLVVKAPVGKLIEFHSTL
jgi:N-acetylglucosamine kinase-like BadF-type ATPase